MSRLGDLIKTERLRGNITPKQVAKRCGVSEAFIIDVEEGRRIIADDLARRILKTIGVKRHTEADFTLEDAAATVDLSAAMEPNDKAVIRNRENVETSQPVGGSIWLDALSGVLKRVPIRNAVMNEVGHRLMPILSGSVEGAPPDKVFYLLAPDDSMRGFRIHKDDLCLIVPSQSPIEGAVMLVEHAGRHLLRKISLQGHTRLYLQSYDRAFHADTYALSDVTFIGRCIRVETEMP